MRKYILSIISIAAVLAVATGCDNNPASPVMTENYSISGTVLLIGGEDVAGGNDVEMQLSGERFSLKAVVDGSGRFEIEDVPDGDYLMTPVLDGFTFDPPVQQVTIAGSDAETGVYYGGQLNDGEYVIAGRAVDSRNIPLEDITVVLYREKGYNATVTGEDGYFLFKGDGAEPLQKGRTYTLSAFRNGYDFRGSSTSGYRLHPDSSIVAIDSRINICEFNYDEPLYSLRARFVDINGVDMEGVSIYLRNNDASRTTYRGTLGPDGSFYMTGLPDGSYRFYFPTSLTLPTYYRFDSSSNTSVAIEGNDVEIEEIIYSYYTGPTFYYLNGRIADSEGAGISGVNVQIEGLIYPLSNSVSDENGYYNCKILIPNGYSETLDVSIRKPGYFFDPSEFNAGQVSWVNGQRDGDIIEAPKVIGYDQETYDAGAFFPLAEGNRWTYLSTGDDGSTTERSIEITGTSAAGGATWMTTSSYGPGSYRNYRVAGNDIHALNRDGEDLLLLQFGVQPGTEWLIRRESDMYDHVGSYGGIETVTAPNGVFEDCEVFTISVEYSAATYETATMWFARGTGMVKMVKTTVSNGVQVESRTDELVSRMVQQY